MGIAELLGWNGPVLNEQVLTDMMNQGAVLDAIQQSASNPPQMQQPQQGATPVPMAVPSPQPLPPQAVEATAPAVMPQQPRPQQAPITDRSVQAPQGQPPVMSAPQPQQPQQPEQPSYWAGLQQRLQDPNVQASMLTFFTALSAPLAPWETAGSRLGRATMMMQMHKAMLDENVRKQPMRDELEQLDVEDKRAEVARKRATGQRIQTEAEIAAATRGDKVKQARTETYKGQTDYEKAAHDLMMDERWEDTERAAKVKMMEEQADYYGRLPKEGKGAIGPEAKYNLESQYEAEIWAPYMDWVNSRRKADPNADVSWTSFLNDTPGMRSLYSAWSRAYSKAGGTFTTRTAKSGEAVSGPQGKRNYTIGPDGKLK